ncbi:MAG: extracellular solute-binding protein, partial [Archaeoglobaceae archaeon]
MAKLSRRDFLKAVVVGIVSLSGAKIVRAQVKSEKSLKIYNWSYYIDETLLDEFSEYAGIPRSRIVYDEYDDPNVVLSKLEAGKSGYDVVILPDYVLDIARRKNLLLELNKSLIPNYSKVDEKFRSTPYDPEGKYSVVYMWGSTGFGYRSDLAEKITSLKQIFDPSYGFLEKYKRKITMLEEPMEVILSCKAYLGKAPDDWS